MKPLKKKNIISLVVLLIFLLLLWSPWMTNSWCKNQLSGYKFGGYKSVDESWIITNSWIPFGRKVDVSVPESERPPEGTIGGYGFTVFMCPFGKEYTVIGH